MIYTVVTNGVLYASMDQLLWGIVLHDPQNIEHLHTIDVSAAHGKIRYERAGVKMEHFCTAAEMGVRIGPARPILQLSKRKSSWPFIEGKKS